MIRLNKVARELNVGIQTLIDILHKNGYADERFTPNTQIDDKQVSIIKELIPEKTYMENDVICVDGVKLDREDKDFFLAVENIMYAKTNITYVTGKAGTGKTTLLKYVAQKLPNVVVLAPTGLAAINAKGQTIHSFFRLPISIFLPDDKRLTKSLLKYNKNKVSIIRKMSYLIIDEVSMLRCDILDAIDKILRLYRNNSSPFGGVKVLLFGDLFQLPVIPPDPQVRKVFYKNYKSAFFFDSKVYRNSQTNYIELTKIHRQSEEEFISFLNSIRVNNISREQLSDFNQRCVGVPLPNSIILAPTNNVVNNYNKQRYLGLNTDEEVFYANIEGKFEESQYPVHSTLSLKIGAQVMLVANEYVDGEILYYNGDIGTVEAFKHTSEKDYIVVNVNDKLVDVYCKKWENISYEYNIEKNIIESSVVGSFCQYPIKLAWAITIHKSQGLTFDNVFIDVNDVFSPGQIYVAISRCRRLNGLRLKAPIANNLLEIDPIILTFSQQQTPQTLLLEQIKRGKADEIYKECRIAIENNDVETLFEKYKIAIKLRDDFGTPLFVKYLKVKLNQLHHLSFCREIGEKLCSRIKEKESQIESLLSKISFLENELQNEKKHAKTLKEDMSNALKAIKDRDTQIATLQYEKSTLFSEIDDKDGQIKQYKKEIMTANVEINRLKNISWFQKLFGVK